MCVRFPLFCMSSVIVSLLFIAISTAQTALVEQRLLLEAGWNAIYLEVDPEVSDCNALFSSLPVESVWFWGNHATDTIQPSTEELITNQPSPLWWVYFPPNRPEHVLTTLHAIKGGRAYLIKAKSNVDWIVRGRPRLPRIAWTENSYNLVGFHVGDVQSPASGSPSFEAFFSGSAHINVNDVDNPIYELNNGQWQAVNAADPVMQGKAYWVFSTGAHLRSGPVEFTAELADRLQFSGDQTTNVITLANLVPRQIPVTLSLDTLKHDHPEYPSLRVSTAGGNEEAHGYVYSLAPAQEGVETSQLTITLELRVSELEQPVSDILTISSPSEGLHFQIPIYAEPSAVTGLWVGIVEVKEVSQPDTDLGAVLKPFRFRMILHVSEDQQVALLNEVVESGRPPAWMSEEYSNETLSQSMPRGALYTKWQGGLNESLQARRISTAAFSFDSPPAPIAGPFGSNEHDLEWNINIEPTESRHPYAHQYHPDHKLKSISAAKTNAVDEGLTVPRCHPISNTAITYTSWTDPNNENKQPQDRSRPKHRLQQLEFELPLNNTDPRAFKTVRIPVKNLVTGTTRSSANTDCDDCNTIDVFDLENYGLEGEIITEWFGGMPRWKDTNGDMYDFFIFWFGGEEPLTVKPILASGAQYSVLIPQPDSDSSYQPIDIYDWEQATKTSGTKRLKGVAISVTDFADTDGNSLPQDSDILGLRIDCPGMNPACVCAVKPPMGILRELTLQFVRPEPGNDLGWGDTWTSGTYIETITGLVKNPLMVQGSFALKHISRIGTLSSQ